MVLAWAPLCAAGSELNLSLTVGHLSFQSSKYSHRTQAFFDTKDKNGHMKKKQMSISLVMPRTYSASLGAGAAIGAVFLRTPISCNVGIL